jgi:hypothetical protein
MVIDKGESNDAFTLKYFLSQAPPPPPPPPAAVDAIPEPPAPPAPIATISIATAFVGTIQVSVPTELRYSKTHVVDGELFIAVMLAGTIAKLVKASTVLFASVAVVLVTEPAVVLTP